MQATQTAAAPDFDAATAQAEIARLLADGRTADVVGTAAVTFIDGLAARLRKVEDEREEHRKLLVHLKEEGDRLRRGLLGQKAERFPRDGAQLSLAFLAMGMAASVDAAAAEAAAKEVERQLIKQHTRRKPKRKPLPRSCPESKSRWCRPRSSATPTPSSRSELRRARSW